MEVLSTEVRDAPECILRQLRVKRSVPKAPDV